MTFGATWRDQMRSVSAQSGSARRTYTLVRRTPIAPKAMVFLAIFVLGKPQMKKTQL